MLPLCLCEGRSGAARWAPFATRWSAFLSPVLGAGALDAAVEEVGEVWGWAKPVVVGIEMPSDQDRFIAV
jgi:hypothetical protein